MILLGRALHADCQRRRRLIWWVRQYGEETDIRDAVLDILIDTGRTIVPVPGRVRTRCVAGRASRSRSTSMAKADLPLVCWFRGSRCDIRPRGPVERSRPSRSSITLRTSTGDPDREADRGAHGKPARAGVCSSRTMFEGDCLAPRGNDCRAQATETQRNRRRLHPTGGTAMTRTRMTPFSRHGRTAIGYPG